MLSVQELGKKLVKAGRLKLGPLCVYYSGEIPQGAMPSYSIDRCIAKAVYTAALFETKPSLFKVRPRAMLPRRNGMDGFR